MRANYFYLWSKKDLKFLSSQIPSVIMLALLSNFKEERKEAISIK